MRMMQKSQHLVWIDERLKHPELTRAEHGPDIIGDHAGAQLARVQQGHDQLARERLEAWRRRFVRACLMPRDRAEVVDVKHRDECAVPLDARCLRLVETQTFANGVPVPRSAWRAATALGSTRAGSKVVISVAGTIAASGAWDRNRTPAPLRGADSAVVAAPAIAGRSSPLGSRTDPEPCLR